MISTICSRKNVYFLTSQLKEVPPIIGKLTAANMNTGVYRKAVERRSSLISAERIENK